MAFAVSHPGPVSEAGEAVEEILGDPFQAVILIVARRNGETALVDELITEVRSIAASASLAVDERELKNRIRGLLKRGLLEGDIDIAVRLTNLGRRVTDLIARR